MNKGYQESKCVDQRIEEISTDRIITSRYQRPIAMRRVEKIAREFDAAKLGLLVVSERPDGYYAILDGQHRLTALRERGINTALAIVLESMSLEQEADYFRHQNDNRAKLDAFDLYNAGIVARDPLYLAVDQLLHDHDLIVCRRPGPKQVSAVASLIRIATNHGLEALNTVLSYIHATWPTDPTAVSREFLAGLTEFYVRLGRQVTVSQFSGQLRKHAPSELLYEYHRRTDGRANQQNAFHRLMRYSFCCVFVDAYNKKPRDKAHKRLRIVYDLPPIDGDERGARQ